MYLIWYDMSIKTLNFHEFRFSSIFVYSKISINHSVTIGIDTMPPYSFNHYFVNFSIYSFIDSFMDSFIDSLIHSFIQSFIHSFIRALFIHAFFPSLIDWLIDYWLIGLFLHSYINLLWRHDCAVRRSRSNTEKGSKHFANQTRVCQLN